MSKIYMGTDFHFGIKPLDLNKWLKMQLNYFYKQVIPYLKETSNKGDIFIILGDLFDNRTSIPILVQNKVEQLLIDMSNILPIHIIVGNHDLWNKGDNSVNSPKLFRHIPNVFIYEKTTTITINNTKLVLMPWVEKMNDMIKEINNNPGDYLFCHSDLNGCKMHLSSVAHNNPNKIDVNYFNDYKKVYSGHIHIRQIQKNFEFIGSPYQMDRNDYNDKKGITILNLKNGDTEFIENIISPTFKRILIKDESDILSLDKIDTNKYYVDLEIYNSVLIGKRKNRKQLELVLSNKKFASISYINDIVKKSIDDEIKLNENVENISISNSNSLDKIIYDYTNIQEYKDDNYKKGVLNELEKIINIYNKEYGN